MTLYLFIKLQDMLWKAILKSDLYSIRFLMTDFKLYYFLKLLLIIDVKLGSAETLLGVSINVLKVWV